VPVLTRTQSAFTQFRLDTLILVFLQSPHSCGFRSSTSGGSRALALRGHGADRSNPNKKFGRNVFFYIPIYIPLETGAKTRYLW